MKGYSIGIFEIIFYFIGSFIVRKSFTNLKTINAATYYWVMMTILTGLWEISYLSNYNEVTIMAHNLITANEHVWTNSYDISYVWPPKLAKIFYAEYGAWADREYMSHSDDWSRIIEGSHCTQCALFAFIAIFFKIIGNHNNFLIALSVSMGTQFMNSYLYMFSYFIQETESDNINYNSSNFPSNKWLTDRPFMWVNIFWLVMPFYTIIYYMCENKKIKTPEKLYNWELEKQTKM
jgi:hypothetical protein